jgi:hypothetical protein
VAHPSDREERRQYPRVDLLTEFQGHLIVLDEAVRVLQLGPGGMTIASPVPLEPSQIHDMRLTIDDRVLTLRARVVHARTTIDRDAFSYVAGVAFVDLPADAAGAISAFLARSDVPAPGDTGGGGAAR